MSIQLGFKVLAQHEDRTSVCVSLTNHTNQSIQGWQLNFAFRYYIYPDSVRLEGLEDSFKFEQVGSFCQLKLPNTFNPKQVIQLYFDVEAASLTQYDDGINEAILVQGEQLLSVELLTPQLISKLDDDSQMDLEKGGCPKFNDSENDGCPEIQSPIIPKPLAIKAQSGNYSFEESYQSDVTTLLAKKANLWLAQSCADISKTTGLNLGLNVLFAASDSPNFKDSDEAYLLTISPEQISIQAQAKAGFFYAVISLVQMIQAQAKQGKSFIECQKILDVPRFGHRGMMLDCARHFHSIETIKQLIDALAQLKFNRFHWHLTDDEGWRIEIKAFPELTQVGAWRGIDKTLEPQYSHLTETYGGFYTQDEIKDVIAFAKARQIEVIPEIDIPGHCRAAIKSLPHLLVEDADKSIYRSVQHYSDNVLNPGLAGTYTFIDTVLEEVCDLFESDYVHMGADEVPQGVWEKSPAAQALIQKEQLDDPKALQGYFLRYVENKLKALGKRMLGWEEICHGDKISTETIICSWTSEEAAYECTKNGFDVILQPAQYTYLDIIQSSKIDAMGANWAGFTPIEKTYSYDPLNQLDRDSAEFKHVLGVQCGLWCELVKDESRLKHMLFPRLYAVSEVAWSAAKNKNWQDFQTRLEQLN